MAKNGSNITDEKVIHMSRHSVVTKQLTIDGSAHIVKCFKPHLYLEHRQIFSPESVKTLLGESVSRPLSLFFRKEEQLLKRLNKISSLAPTLEKVNEYRRQVYMEYIEGPTFKDKFLEIGGDEVLKNYYRQKILELISSFHSIVNANKDYLEGIQFKGQNILKPKSVEEEREKIRRCAYLIVGNCSEEYKRRFDFKGGTVRHQLDLFLNEKNINLDQWVTNFVDKYRQIIYGELNPDNKNDLETLVEKGKICLTHGDCNPGNLFYLEKKEGKICDFDECRWGNRWLDVINAVWNIYSNPSEGRMPGLIVDYLVKVHELENKEFDYQEAIAECIATKLHESFRLFAVDSDLSYYEADNFIRGLPYEKIKEPKKRKDAFIQDRFAKNFKEVFSFYLRGEGWSKILNYSQKKDTIYKLLSMVEDFFQITGVWEDMPDKRYKGPSLLDLGQDYLRRKVVKIGGQ